MHAIREIRTVKEGHITLHLPHIFRGQKVEIIVLPVQKEQSFRKKSLRGCLQQYANPELIVSEKDVWQESAGEKHVLR